MTPKSNATKINTWDCIKLYVSAHGRKHSTCVNAIYRMGENVVNDLFDKSLISKICKKLIQLNKRKTCNPIKDKLRT